jgi:hypothetical protein
LFLCSLAQRFAPTPTVTMDAAAMSTKRKSAWRKRFTDTASTAGRRRHDGTHWKKLANAATYVTVITTATTARRLLIIRLLQQAHNG